MMNKFEVIDERYALFDYHPAGHCVLNKKMTVLYWNKTLEIWTGISRDKIVGTVIESHFPHFLSQSYSDFMKMVLKNGIPIVLSPQIHKYLIPAPLPDGRFRYQSTVINRIPANEKGEFHLLLILHDVTTLSEAIERYRGTLKKYRELNQHLDQRVKEEIESHQQAEQFIIHQSKLAAMGEMIGAIAHQWRQPLNALGLIIQDIQDAYEFGELDKEYFDNTVKESLNQIQFMSKTIDDFRDFYKPSKKKESFIIMQAVNSAVSIQKAQLKHNNINIMISSESKGGLTVTGYPNEFKQVVVNILSNAGSAILEARQEGLLGKDDGDILINLLEERDKIIIKIHNTGKSIPAEIIDRIFEPYFTTKNMAEGTGIGLYMSKIIIEKHMNGRLYADNQKNGVQFTIELFTDV